MNTKKLTKVANDKGYSVGRKKSNHYYYGYSNGQEYREFDFLGTWHHFVKFISETVAPQPGSEVMKELLKNG